MDPSERLRQLREQHQLVARHLAWLESEIAKEETSEDSAYTPALAATPAPADKPAAPVAPLDEPETVFEPNSAVADQARRSRMGCILVSFAGAAILLFLIWGLPQILY